MAGIDASVPFGSSEVEQRDVKGRAKGGIAEHRNLMSGLLRHRHALSGVVSGVSDQTKQIYVVQWFSHEMAR